MKKTILLTVIAIIAICTTSNAQSKEPYNDKQNMAVVTSQEPFYPKGDTELFKYVLNAIKYSDEAKAKYIEGNITLSFDVSPDSTISNISVISGLCCGINEEIQRVVKELKFAPAIQNGVKMRMNVMMDFPVKAH
ncbi:MAG: TonB family protein [Bacteroidia bacterium]|nr:TonB family protein [Bacteroidia bacterium]MCZ2248232.1 energy transducer TonB [Bacteroidia bacterium]